MKTTKERLATAIHTPLKETLSFYKTSLTGLTEEQVEKNRDLYGEKHHHQGSRRQYPQKDLRIYYQSIYNHPAGHRYDFHGDQCLVGEAWTRRSDDLYHHRRSRSNLWWRYALSKNCGVTRLRPIYQK